ncbi:D-alanine--D-alanine ligase [Patescibacteria group bacterium]|nr:MAG: D-alanine--D-alanine ligase [Patescibacteria group bacterium]
MSTDVLNRGKLRVGVLRGGPSPEYEVSLQSGAQVLRHLPEKYVPLDIFISQDGDWHVRGVTLLPERALREADLVVNALHGAYGEDGKVQTQLEYFGIPYTGSRALSAALSMNKARSKQIFENHGIKTPVSAVLPHSANTHRNALELFKTFPQPSIVKPLFGGSSIGISVARTFPEFALGIEEAFRHGGHVLIEEYIPGREATASVVESATDRSLYSLFPVEVVRPPGKHFFDYQSKYVGETEKICPSKFSREEKEQIQNWAMKVHRALGLRHYSNADFIIHPKRGVYLIEANALPGLTPKSLLPKALEVAELSFPDFLDHLVHLALRRG